MAGIMAELSGNPNPKSRIPWPRIFAEGVVIVASILLALAADAWWAGVQARRTAYQELGTVQIELQESWVEIESVAERNELSLSGTLALQTLLESAPVDATVSVPDTLVSQLLAMYVSDVATAVTDAFVSSGGLEELRDGELRRRLLRWRPLVVDLRDDEARTRDHLDQQVVPYLRAFDITQAIDLPGRQRDPGEAQFPSAVELRNLLRMQSSHLRVLGIQYRGALGDLEELTRLVDQELF